MWTLLALAAACVAPSRALHAAPSARTLPKLAAPAGARRVADLRCEEGGDDLSSVVAKQEQELGALRAEMQAMKEALRVQELAAEDAVRHARSAAIQEASEVIAMAELSDLLMGTLHKRDIRVSFETAPSEAPAEPLYGEWSVKGAPAADAQTSHVATRERSSGAGGAGGAGAASGVRAAGSVSETGETADARHAAAGFRGNLTFDEWLASQDFREPPPLPPVPAGRYPTPEQSMKPSRRQPANRRKRKAAVRRAAHLAIDSAIAAATAADRASGPRPQLVPPLTGAKREVRYTRYGNAPADFPRGIVEALIEKRTKARLKKHYNEADRLQARIQRMGVRLDDRRRTWSVVKGWKKMQEAEAAHAAATGYGVFTASLPTSLPGAAPPDPVPAK